MYAETVTLNTSRLRVGMVVCNHGMRVRIDEVHEYAASNTVGDVAWACYGTVINMPEAAAARIVPMSWLRQRVSEGAPADRDDFWSIQGNRLAEWYVELSSVVFGQLTSAELLEWSAMLKRAGERLSQGNMGELTAWQREASMAAVDAYLLRGDIHDVLATR